VRGNIETKANVCMDLVAKYQNETKDKLDTKAWTTRTFARSVTATA